MEQKCALFLSLLSHLSQDSVLISMQMREFFFVPNNSREFKAIQDTENGRENMKSVSK